MAGAEGENGMRAITYEVFGSPDVLELRDIQTGHADA
jgi:hypothetical protein